MRSPRNSTPAHALPLGAPTVTRFTTGLGATIALVTTLSAPAAHAQGSCPVVADCTHTDWTLQPGVEYWDSFGPAPAPFPPGIQLSVPQFDPAYYALLEGVPENLIELVAVELNADTTVWNAQVYYKNDHPTNSCSMDWTYDVAGGIDPNPVIGSPGLYANAQMSGSTGTLAPGEEYLFTLSGPITESQCVSWRVQDYDLSPWIGTGSNTFDAVAVANENDAGSCSVFLKQFSNSTSVTATATYYYCIADDVVVEETIVGCYPTTPVACQSLQPLDWGVGGIPPGVITVPKFDSSKGDLLSVAVTYKAQYVGQACVDNLDVNCCLAVMSSDLFSTATSNANNNPPLFNIGPFALNDSLELTPAGFLLGASDGVSGECSSGPVGPPSIGDCTPGEDHFSTTWDVTFETPPQSTSALSDLIAWTYQSGFPGFVEFDTTAIGTFSGQFCGSIASTYFGEARVWLEVTYTYSPGMAYCFGDPGSGIPCPCGNDNDGSVPGSGCNNGAFASGAHLTRSGFARVSYDTLVLHTSGLEPNNAGLYFQAENRVAGGNGSWWGDGLRCAGGDLRRLGVRFSDPSGYSDTSGLPLPISIKAGNVMPGDVKHYQCWFRTQANPPCGLGINDFNTSNGFTVIWLP